MLGQTRQWMDVTAWVALVIGLMLFLMETHSTGEALEVLTLKVLPNAISVTGVALAVAAIVALVVLHLGDLRRMLKHR
jgi:hypothetical protein